MSFALIGGLELYFEVTGDGPPLMFLNGSGSTITEVRPLVRPLADEFQVTSCEEPRSFTAGRNRIPVWLCRRIASAC